MEQGTIKIINSKAFCLYKGDQIGIASGEAGHVFRDGLGDEYLTYRIFDSGDDNFIWTDAQGYEHFSNRHDMTRPNIEDIVQACIMWPYFAMMAEDQGLIEMSKEEINWIQQTPIGDLYLN